MNSYLFIIFSILLIWNYRLGFEFPEYLVVSAVDGKTYAVKRQFRDRQKASDILARLNVINTTIIAHMEKKYANTESADSIQFLSENYNGDVLSEHIPRTTVNTSYVLNKGDMIKICLRDPQTKIFHDFQTIVFVNLHELSHLLDREYGHNISFWRGFKTILEEAVELGLYKPVDYHRYPVKYCGIIINNSPLWQSYK